MLWELGKMDIFGMIDIPPFSGTNDRMSNFYEMTIAELKIRLSVDRAFKML